MGQGYSTGTATNIGMEHGMWGEDVAVERLRREGLEIVERNARPASYDKRLEIDIVAYDPRADMMVFVEVKQHAAYLEEQGRLRGVDDRKRRNLRRAFGAWRSVNKWFGDYRFDVIEVYGKPGSGRPLVDHLTGVSLLPRRRREQMS